MAAILLGVVALGLTALVVFRNGSDDATVVPDEVSGVLDDFEAAYENGDAALLESIITEDFRFDEHFYVGDAATPAFSVGGPAFSAIDGVASSTWQLARFGEPIVTGSGPWFVTVGETWTDPANRYDGTAGYVIVDDGGDPRISIYWWSGVKVDVLPDWAD